MQIWTGVLLGFATAAGAQERATQAAMHARVVTLSSFSPHTLADSPNPAFFTEDGGALLIYLSDGASDKVLPRHKRRGAISEESMDDTQAMTLRLVKLRDTGK